MLGYTCGNDVSARGLQFAEMATGVLMMGKGMDGFKPLGPCIATDLDPTNLAITSRRNGETLQQSNTSDLLFSVASLITYLRAGDDVAARRLHLHRDARRRWSNRAGRYD